MRQSYFPFHIVWIYDPAKDYELQELLKGGNQ
jgi:hypothetical protein